MSLKGRRFIIGLFEDEENLIESAHELKKNQITIYDIYTPFPVHGLDDLLDIKRTRLPIVCFFAATIGFIASIYFQIWTSKSSWPLNVGGKPFNSFPAFIPVSFEITVLFGALLTVAAFFIRIKLFPGKKVEIPNLRVTDDAFALVVEELDAGLDIGTIETIFQKHGVTEVTTRGGEEWEQ